MNISLRRYFGVTAQVPYTDVWTHKPVQYYPGKHPCEKPAEMLQQIISASSRPGTWLQIFHGVGFDSQSRDGAGASCNWR
ncbi:DNA methyltransferase [Escherichia coli]|nr:DNA methyltransferase [Escherichia coli]